MGEPRGPIGAAAHAQADPLIAAFRDALLARHGAAVQAILLYGSWVRGQRETVLDFYVLLDRYAGALPGALGRLANRVLPPNVYFLTLEHDGARCAAKYATVTVDQFERGVRHAFHGYFWARFAQPFTAAYVRAPALTGRLESLQRAAGTRLARATVPLLDAPFDTATLWTRALALSYGCELRTEDTTRAAALAAAYGETLDALTRRCAPDAGLEPADTPGSWRPAGNMPSRTRCRWGWRLRRVQGKLLSALRLLKAAFTFNDPLDYVLWKVERHSGVRAEPTALQRRHPLIFSWPLLWKVYRQGGFR